MKKYLKKSLSTFLALLMVFTSLVFVAPEVVPEAEAAGSYSYSVSVARDKNGGGSDSPAYIRVYYYPINADGTLDKSNTNLYNNHDLSKVTSNAYVNYTGTVSGWPYKVVVNTDNADTNNEDLKLNKIVVNGKTVISTDTQWTIDDEGDPVTFSYDVTPGGSGFTFDWPEPDIPEFKWSGTSADLSKNLTVPYEGKTVSFTSVTVPEWKDNEYGVALGGADGTQPKFRITSDADGKNVVTVAGTTLTNNGLASNKTASATFSITNEVKKWVAENDTDNQAKLYLWAYCGDAVTGSPIEITLNNLVYDANFENLFSLNGWYAANTFPSNLGVTIDQMNGKLTLKNNGTSGEITVGTSYQIPVKAGEKYTLEYTRGEDTQTDMYVFFNNSTDPSIFNDGNNRLTANKAGTYSKEFTTPAGITFVTIRFDANTPGETYTFSGVKFYKTSSRENVTISADRAPVYSNEAIGELPTATKIGYTFDGWYTGENGTGSPVTSATLVDSNVTYYAKWTPVKNIAKFYNYDGQLHATVEGGYGTKISAALPLAPASYTNSAGTYEFYRWVNTETNMPLGDEIFDGTNEGDLVAEYKAEFKKSGTTTTYTATFVNPYDASYSGSASGYFNQSLSTPTNPTRSPEQINGVDAYDYDFIGWALSENGDVVIKPGSTFRILENVTYYACFEQKLAQHTITTVYGTNAGGANAGTLTYTNGYGEWVALPNPSEWRDNTNSYIFSHWVDTNGVTYEPTRGITNVQILGSMTYTAVYDSVPVRYHAYFYNGAEQVFDQELQYNDYVTIPNIEDPEKDRVGNTTYEFDGWYLYDAETNTWGEKLESNKFFITGDDYTFYAKYNEIKWSNIRFLKDADNGYEQIGKEVEYVWDSVITVPDGPEKESTAQYDYKFTGWTAYPGGEFYEAGAEIKAPQVDTAYIATYEATVRKYTVTFYGEDGETTIGDPQTLDYGTTPVVPADPTKESTERYDYVFDGWYDGTRIYDGNEIPAVTGDVTYRASFTGKDVYYQVHWLTPHADGTYADNTVNYTYNRVISMPSTTPAFENEVEKEGYTWGFTGWYLADKDGNLVNANGEVVADKADGVPFARGTQITGTLYYVATFDYIANSHRINVYDEDGEILRSYTGAYGSDVYVANFAKDPVAEGHFVLQGFATEAGGKVVYAADTVEGTEVLDTVTKINVTTNLDLYVVYLQSEGHDYDEWDVDVEATYKDKGSKHRDCVICSYREEAEIAQLVDETDPTAQITIGGNSWSNEYELGENNEPIYNSYDKAYIRSDAIVSILTSDVGNGIKSIKYTWMPSGETFTHNVSEEFDTAVNYNFALPSDFEGQYLEALITDYVGKTYTVQTATLESDTVAPEILTHIDCVWFGFAFDEEHEIDKITVTGPDGNAVAFESIEVTDEDGNAMDAYAVGDMDGETVLASGKYTIAVSDKAGNTAKETINFVGGHKTSDWIVDVAVTCLENGLRHKECTVCGKVLEEETIYAVGHDEENAEWVVDIEPACEVKGEKSLRCAVCDEKLLVAEIEALEHDYEAVVTEPTCEEQGYTTHTCKLCDNSYVDTWVEAKDHDMKVAEEVDPTCHEPGYTVYACANCDYTYEETGAPALNHPEDQCETIVIESECTGSSITKVVCKLCGEVVTQVGDLSGHEWETTKTVLATCTEDSYHVESCTKCDAEITIVDRLSRLGHAWDADYTTDKKATCEEDGSKSIHCANCDEKKNVTAIPATGHDLVLDEESKTEATCNTDGYEKWECSACDYSEEKTITATGAHNFTTLDEDASYDATCTKDGLEVYKCGGTDCTATKEVVIPATGHEQGEKVSETAGTCQTKGSVTYKCANCEEQFTEEGQLGDHVASDELVKTTKAPTCTEAGDGVYKCEYCNATVVGTGKIKALGHDYVRTTVEADCLNGGSVTEICSRCGDKQVISTTGALGHDWEDEYTIDTAATCLINGSKSIHCAVCDAINPETVTAIQATGQHTESDWIIDEHETCTEAGSKHTECTVCGTKVKTEAIPSKGGHVKGALVKTNTPATCCTEGEGVYKCKVCGGTYIAAIEVDPDNHSYSAWVKVDATCTEPGTQTKTCENKKADGTACTAKVEKVIPAKGHDYSLTKEEVVEEGGNFVTKQTYTCSRCKGTNTETVETTAYLVTIVDQVSGNNSSVVLKNGAQLLKSNLPEIVLPEDEGETTYVLKWIYADGTEVKFPVDVTSNITIYAKAEPVTKTYTVNFVNNAGKIISTAEYELNDEVVVPEDQVLLNHTFLGWSDGTTVYAPEAVPAVTGDATYFAEFEANEGVITYYVTYKNDTGSKTLFTQTVVAEGTVAAPEMVPTKATNSVYHYVFAGWVDADGKAFDFSSKITSNVTLMAKFNAVKHSEDAKSTTIPASCSTAEETYNVCNGCGYEWTTYTNPATGHTYKEVSRETTADGKVMVTYTCNVCGDTWTKTVTQGMADANAITVTVNDTSGKAVEGATVTIYVGDLKVTTAVTNANGKAYFSKEVVTDGSYRVVVTKTGYDNLAGTLTVQDGKGTVKLSSFSITECHSICHADNFFAKIRRWFTDLIRILFKNYNCCDCGHCGTIY